jgi:RNA 3'-terminal phosphate cyclase (ATP)
MLEGGGQILRNAASLAAITGTAITINNIRAKRTKPGLRPQHLTCLQLIESLSKGSTLSNASVGSTDITFSPSGRLQGGPLVADTGTAGSCMLLAQVALPCLLYAKHEQQLNVNESMEDINEIQLKGGTDAAMAPPIEYMQRVLLPTLRHHLHVHAHLELVRRGFFPRGQGLVKLKVKPLPAESSHLPPIIITSRGDIEEVIISVFTAGKIKVSIGERMMATAEKIVEKRIAETIAASAAGSALREKSIKINKSCVHEPPERAFGDGCGIIIVARSSTGCLLGATGLGERGISAEDVAQRAADDLMDLIFNCKACVDDHLVDQLVIFMALAEGRSEIIGREPTLHTRTAIAVAEILTKAKFEIRKLEEGGLWSISCQGAGIPGVMDNDAG